MEVQTLHAAAVSDVQTLAAPAVVAPWARNWDRDRAGTLASPAAAAVAPVDLLQEEFG
jgi:hypothetical protein